MKFKIISAFLLICINALAQRSEISLDGTWSIAESVLPIPVPAKFDHSGPVPGLADLATPAFQDVNQFDGVDYLKNGIVKQYVKNVPTDTVKVGISRQKRNFFWYRKEFTLAENTDLVVLKINKAQFGTAVWVNGKKAGEHFGCFSAAFFDITRLVRQPGKNSIVIRIGAHPGVLPDWVPSGSDYEKPTWTPGIYDDVTLIATNVPYISSVQVAPHIENSSVTVRSVIINRNGNKTFSLRYRIRPYQASGWVNEWTGKPQEAGNNDTVTVTETFAFPGAKLWTPESPDLYILETSDGYDVSQTRFGMREFRFDTRTKKAYLNGKLYYLRGSNITLHRFFDDDHCGNKPWDEAWVRKLLVDWPHKLHWNAFRFCIGPVPDKWLDIADESGLLIQNEFFIWPYHANWDTVEIRNQVSEWMRDNWNHPSVAWWDICNETDDQELRDIIRRVRDHDLSNRAWDNGYGLPVGDNDPVEDHHYLFYGEDWSVKDFEDHVAAKTTNSPHPSAHAAVVNEYGWLWLRRDGTPTLLTRDVFNHLAPGATNEQRIDLAAYLLGLETEYFRAHRNYAGVLHFDFLAGNFKNSITGDLFRNIDSLTIYPAYLTRFTEAFRPLGVYINFTREIVKPGGDLSIRVMLINDEYRDLSGTLVLKIADDAGNPVVETKKDFEVDTLGEQTIEFKITIPSREGKYTMTATAASPREDAPTVSLRKMTVTNK